mmetsp:Transcript_27691/g.65001  ORF Transcript_27691/g.65001 Transcript_27691/m.65001 type:complete len:184 (+) Transcript_27691:137-688(+)
MCGKSRMVCRFQSSRHVTSRHITSDQPTPRWRDGARAWNALSSTAWRRRSKKRNSSQLKSTYQNIFQLNSSELMSAQRDEGTFVGGVRITLRGVFSLTQRPTGTNSHSAYSHTVRGGPFPAGRQSPQPPSRSRLFLPRAPRFDPREIFAPSSTDFGAFRAFGRTGSSWSGGPSAARPRVPLAA